MAKPSPLLDTRSILQSEPTRPLRVVHLGKYYPPASGGIETHTQTLARAQIKLGAEVSVVVVNHADHTGKDVTFERFGRTPDTVGYDGTIRLFRTGRLANVAKLDVTPGLLGILQRIRREFAPDIWHLHTPNITMMLAVLADRKIRPLVVTHHSDIIRQKLLRYAVAPLEQAICQRASQILYTTENYITGSPLLQRFRSKLMPLPLGLDLQPFREPSSAALAAGERLRKESTGPIWLSVGRLIYYKALDVSLRALREVPGTLVVIGTGPMETTWRRLATELGVADRVRWMGRATEEELIGAYQVATAHWFPSNARSEGFGLVQVEAMASGCPVINADILHSGVTWVCRHDREGLTIPPNNTSALASAASRLLTEPGLRDRLAAAGRIRAETEFDWMVMGRRSLEIYESVVNP